MQLVGHSLGSTERACALGVYLVGQSQLGGSDPLNFCSATKRLKR